MKRLVVKHPENCLACGSCARACSKSWYKTEDDSLAGIRVTIGEHGPLLSVCDQCGACAAACPGDLIVKSDDKQIVTKCTACGLCVKACPAAVLAIEEV